MKSKTSSVVFTALLGFLTVSGMSSNASARPRVTKTNSITLAFVRSACSDLDTQKTNFLNLVLPKIVALGVRAENIRVEANGYQTYNDIGGPSGYVCNLYVTTVDHTKIFNSLEGFDVGSQGGNCFSTQAKADAAQKITDKFHPKLLLDTSVRLENTLNYRGPDVRSCGVAEAYWL